MAGWLAAPQQDATIASYSRVSHIEVKNAWKTDPAELPSEMIRRKNGRKSTPLPFEWHQIEGSSIFLSIILSDIFGVLFSFFSVWVGQIHHQQ